MASWCPHPLSPPPRAQDSGGLRSLGTQDGVRHSRGDAASALGAQEEAGTPTRWAPPVPGAAGKGRARHSRAHSAYCTWGGS